MNEFLTIRGAPALPPIKERKVYDLAGEGSSPARRVTGKQPFPRAEIEEWIESRGAVACLSAGAPSRDRPL